MTIVLEADSSYMQEEADPLFQDLPLPTLLGPVGGILLPRLRQEEILVSCWILLKGREGNDRYSDCPIESRLVRKRPRTEAA